MSAFVERRQPETNTFHMPFGEMTITDDVGTILDIPLTGRSVSADLLSHEAAIDLVNSQLGISCEDGYNELSNAHGSSVKNGVAKGHF